MGQGLHTKTMQVASKVLDIPIELVHIIETATDKVSTDLGSLSETLIGTKESHLGCPGLYRVFHLLFTRKKWL